MTKLKLDDLDDLLPDLDELRPIAAQLLTRSKPNESRAWSGSGVLDTAGSRLVDEAALRDDIENLVHREADHLNSIYEHVSSAITAVASGDPAAAAYAFLAAATLEEARDRPRRASAYAESAYKACREAADQGPAALALRRWARAERALGRLGPSLDNYSRSYGISSAIGDGPGAADAAIGAGNVLEEQGRWEEAASRYRDALAALDDVQEAVPQRWHALLNLHITARSRGAFSESIEWLEQAEGAAAESGADEAEPFFQNARGQLEMARGDFPKAEEHLRSALDGAPGSFARVTIGLNLSEALLAQGRALESAEQAREAERDAIRGGVTSKLPEVYRLLGRIASQEGNPDAFVLFERALAIVREGGLTTLEEALTLQAYAESEARRGETESASSLSEASKRRFELLGIHHAREAWADVYGPSSDQRTDLPTGSQDHEE